MIRMVLLLLATLASCGCSGEPERPRFIPSAGKSGPSSSGHRGPGDGPAEAAVPQNIKMH